MKKKTKYIIAGGAALAVIAAVILCCVFSTPHQDGDEAEATIPSESVETVVFRGESYDRNAVKLKVEDLSEGELDILAEFPELKSLRIESCSDLNVIASLRQRYPELRLIYSVEVGGKTYSNYVSSLTVNAADAGELLEKLEYLPYVTTVELADEAVDKEQLLELKEAYPSVVFDADFEVFGVSTNSMTEKIDLSNIKFEKAEDAEAILPYFYNLAQVDMVNCGLTNDEMDALNKRHADVKFVWAVSVCGITLRTDAKFFMPVKYELKKLSDCSNLRYCTDMEALDFGHYGISNLDFVQYMPKLKYLLLCDGRVSDATAIGQCTSLEFLEVFSTLISDYWPLTNLTNLKDLNLGGTPCQIYEGNARGYGPFGDYTPLLQMTWLDRLWIPYTFLDSKTKATIQEALPNTTIVFENYSMTGGGGRFTPSYYAQRDTLGMYYGAN